MQTARYTIGYVRVAQAAERTGKHITLRLGRKPVSRLFADVLPVSEESINN